MKKIEKAIEEVKRLFFNVGEAYDVKDDSFKVIIAGESNTVIVTDMGFEVYGEERQLIDKRDFGKESKAYSLPEETIIMSDLCEEKIYSSEATHSDRKQEIAKGTEMTKEQKIARIEELKKNLQEEYEKGNCSEEVVALCVECTRLAREVVCGY